MKGNQEIFNKIAEALLIDYTSVYYVNAVTNEYVCRSVGFVGSRLDLEWGRCPHTPAGQRAGALFANARFRGICAFCRICSFTVIIILKSPAVCRACFFHAAIILTIADHATFKKLPDRRSLIILSRFIIFIYLYHKNIDFGICLTKSIICVTFIQKIFLTYGKYYDKITIHKQQYNAQYCFIGGQKNEFM